MLWLMTFGAKVEVLPQKRLNKEQREKNMRRLMGKLQYYGDFRDMTKE